MDEYLFELSEVVDVFVVAVSVVGELFHHRIVQVTRTHAENG